MSDTESLEKGFARQVRQYSGVGEKQMEKIVGRYFEGRRRSSESLEKLQEFTKEWERDWREA
jgi:predicted subunit of tRNA(5-methylaminomethyl-2-thiouridylate) methyltransferase